MAKVWCGLICLRRKLQQNFILFPSQVNFFQMWMVKRCIMLKSKTEYGHVFGSNTTRLALVLSTNSSNLPEMQTAHCFMSQYWGFLFLMIWTIKRNMAAQNFLYFPPLKAATRVRASMLKMNCNIRLKPLIYIPTYFFSNSPVTWRFTNVVFPTPPSPTSTSCNIITSISSHLFPC